MQATCSISWENSHKRNAFVCKVCGKACFCMCETQKPSEVTEGKYFLNVKSEKFFPAMRPPKTLENSHGMKPCMCSKWKILFSKAHIISHQRIQEWGSLMNVIIGKPFPASHTSIFIIELMGQVGRYFKMSVEIRFLTRCISRR